MQVRLLGPVDVVADGEPRAVPGLRRKAVLAALAVQSGEVVSISQLVEVVWAGSAPPTAANTLQNHVSHLRYLLGSKTAIRARAPGYVLDLGPDGTDVRVAERLLEEGQQAADPALAARRLTAALALWRGRPLADLTGLPWLEDQAERLDLLGAAVRRALFEARLAAGEHVSLLPELARLVADRPLDEQVQAQYMLALYRSGRQADALAAYRRLHQTLSAELGIYPSQELRDLEVAILRQEPALDAPAAAALARAAPQVPVPAQLPPAVPSFAGRAGELARLDALLPSAVHPGPAQPGLTVVTVLSGTAGVGKTTLAVHWAHQVASRFPDGQLYVNLQGFDPGGAALEPGEAVRGFLEAFGVPASRIPAALPAQAALYRSLLAGKQVLVVLDNARDVDQVRPLLPGSPGCLAVVTSRDRLTGLVATGGAYPLTLDLLPAADARDLLIQRVGPARVASEPAAADDIVARCARLPLALTIAAARAATHPSFPLAVFAAELREATHALDPFQGGDLTTDVRAVFSWSYRALSPAAARLFRLLGLHPGPDIGLAAAASLAAAEPDQARAPLAELTRAHLLAEHAPGRYACHDLLRSYAAEQAMAEDSPDVRAAAVHRVLDHYLHTAARASVRLEPQFAPPTPAPAGAGVTVGELATAGDAAAWFTAEHATLLAAVLFAAGSAGAGHTRHAWQLGWMLSTAFLRRGSWDDNTRAQRAALDAARRAADIVGEAHASHGLALGYARSGRFADAWPQFQHALGLLETTGDQIGQARVHDSLAWLSERDERPADALGHATRSFELFRAAGSAPGQAMALNDIGYCHALLGNYRSALDHCERGLHAIQQLGERNWEAATWDSLGYIHHQLGDHQRSFACYRRAITLYRELADRFNEADTLDHLGDAQLSAGAAAAARQTWTAALRIYDEINHPDGAQVRAKLRSAVPRGAPAPAGGRTRNEPLCLNEGLGGLPERARLQAFAAGFADRHADRGAQPGQRAGRRALGLDLADVLAGDVHDLADPAEREARRLQGRGRVRLGVADHARDRGRVVAARGDAAFVAFGHHGHVGQVADQSGHQRIAHAAAEAQVEQAVRAPGEQRAVGAQRHAGVQALADLGDPAQVDLDRAGPGDVGGAVADLALEVDAPGPDLAAAAHQGQGVVAAGGDLGHPGQRHGHRRGRGRLAVTQVTAAPGQQGPVGAQRVAVPVARRHLDDPGQPGYLLRRGPAGLGPVAELPAGIVAPGQDGAVRAQRERVIGPGGQLGDPGQPGYLPGHVPARRGAVAQLAVIVVTPAPHRAASAHRHHVEGAHRDLGDPGQPGHLDRGVPVGRRPVAQLAEGVAAPGPHRAVGQQGGVGLGQGAAGELFRADLQSAIRGQSQHGFRGGLRGGRPVAVLARLVVTPAEDGGETGDHGLRGRHGSARRRRSARRRGRGRWGGGAGDRRDRDRGAGDDRAHAAARAPASSLHGYARSLPAGRGRMPHGRPVVLAGLWHGTLERRWSGAGTAHRAARRAVTGWARRV